MALATKTIKRVFEHAILLILVLTFAHGCASNLGAKTSNSENVRNIKSVNIFEKDDSINVRIQADQPLTYTSVKQPFPLGQIFYFPGSRLTEADIESVPENDLINKINASESTSPGRTARIEISLKKDIPFEVDDSGNGLIISFFKVKEESVTEEDLSSSKTEEAVSSDAMHLEDVVVGKIAEGVEVSVLADGSIADFESFTIDETTENPARIVFDFFGINSPFEEEQKMTLESESVQSIRHRGYKDRVRIVIDTKNQYLRDFSAKPFNKGIKIKVGKAGKKEKEVAKVETSEAIDMTSEVSDANRERIETSKESAAGSNFAEKTSETVSDKMSETPWKTGGGPNMIASVNALSSESGLLISLKSDFSISKFESFTIQSSDDMPARIVFDLPGAQSPFKKEQSIQVNTEWAKRVRYCKHPEKVRLVVDTYDQYLKTYSASPVENGLEILVGTDFVEEAGQMAEASTDEPAEFIETAQSGETSKSLETATMVSSEPKEAAEPVENTEASKAKEIAETGEPAEFIETAQSGETSESLETATMVSSEPKEAAEPVEATETSKANEIAEAIEIAETAEDVESKEGVKQDLSQPKEETVVAHKPEKEKVHKIDTESEEKSAVSQAYSSGKALVNRIDFQSKEAAKSEIIIGTNKPVVYEIKKVNDKKVVLQLFDTKLAEHQKRPLITTRFESAVDRVLPIQRKGMKDTLISIELREMVDYEIKQIDSILKLQFAASSIPPKAFEDAELPPWKKIMAQTEPFAQEKGGEDESELSGEYDDVVTVERGSRKKYTGEKVALDFYETDIKNVFRILREVGGKNFAIDKDVSGKVTMTLEKPVPWDQVLDLVLKMNQLGKIVDGDIIRIARTETITQEENARQARIEAEARAKEQEKAVEPLKTEYLQINYSDAKTEILPHLEKIATAERGSLSVDQRTNTIIMVDTHEKISHAKQIIRHLDRVTPQVIIETRIVEASNNFSKAIGIEWALDGGIPNDDPRAGIGPQKAFDALGGTWGYDAAVNLPVVDTGSIGFEFKRILGTPFELDARLGAMEELGEVRIVSAPKVLTLDNKKASIKQGREVPYSVVGENAMVDVEYKEADLLLEVTPHVTADQRISLRVFITNNEVAETLPSGEPIIATKEAETELLINDGETVVIGGILQTADDYVESKIPGLGNIPVLRWLFKSNSTIIRKNEMMIFLTPRILQLEQKEI